MALVTVAIVAAAGTAIAARSRPEAAVPPPAAAATSSTAPAITPPASTPTVEPTTNPVESANATVPAAQPESNPGTECVASYVSLMDGFKHSDYTQEALLAAAASDPVRLLSKRAIAIYMDPTSTASEADRVDAAGSVFRAYCATHPTERASIPAGGSVEAYVPDDATDCGAAGMYWASAGPKTSCKFAVAVGAALEAAGSSPAYLTVRSPVTRQMYTMLCDAPTPVVVCRSATTTAVVYLQ